MSFDFKSLTIRGFDTAFEIGSDLVRDVVYHDAKASAYDTAEGAVTPSSTAIECKGMFLGVDNTQKDIKQSDVRVLIRCAELDLLPSTEDWIDDDGVRLEIVSYRRDPLQGAFSFHCRPVPAMAIIPAKSFIIPQAQKDKIIAYWKMDEVGGTRLDNAVSASNLLEDPAHGRAVGSDVGKIGLAGVFTSGPNTVLRNTSGIGSGYLILDATSCSINLWLNPNGPHNGFILGRYNPIPEPQAYDYFLKLASDQLHFQVKTDAGSGNVANILTCPAPQFGAWSMVSAVYNVDTNEQQLFVNGVLKASRTGIGMTQAGFPEGVGVDFTVGAGGTGSDPTLNFQGKIDEIAFSTIAFTPEDIFLLYNGGDGCTW